MLLRDPLVPDRPRMLAQSAAFREASLRSEVRRAYAVLAIIGIITVLLFLNGSMLKMTREVRLVTVVGLAALVATQVGVLAFAGWSRRAGRAIALWFIVVTVLVESLVPSSMILVQIIGDVLPPYTALVAPPILAYGILIGLSTLRLRPWLCALFGTISAGSYAAMLMYVTTGLRIMPPEDGLPHFAYVNNALLLFVAGLAAAWVARELRGHMEVALQEAETRRQIDRIEQDLLNARTIQQALLPRAAPDVPGFDIAGWNRPADQTGGDYYDWQELPDGNWIVTVADVSGHGIGPALVTAACRAYVRASGDHRGDLPTLTGRINALLADDLPEGRFVTMVSVLINPRTQPIALLSAGHGPIVFYVGSTGKVQDILPGDLPLAVSPDSTFGPPQSIIMGVDDVLALVTDGFVEWAKRDAGGNREEFGVDRLRKSLSRHAHLSAQQMIEAITGDVAAFAGDVPQQDDLTIVIIRRVAAVAGSNRDADAQHVITGSVAYAG